ncbi:MAG: XRE family transcriptional regulator, partial [Anaerolineaceae bacterium]|nr:XRE family transcriptional regulator [Anaerolineaceae bacterium]
QEGEWSYLDTYLGGYAFIGEEAVWKDELPLWGMNYYGTMTVPGIPDGFGDFLKLALRGVLYDAPYRGPAQFTQERYTYTCRWEGDLAFFHGTEEIARDGLVVYRLFFHGGAIQ